MIGSQTYCSRILAQTAEFHHGSGRAFRFERLPSLPDELIWVLTLITDRTGPNGVRLSYTVDQVPVAGSEATEGSLSTMRYNFHPSGDCAKHEVKLRYEHPSDAPEILAYVVQNGHVWARTKVLTEIEVLAVDGASCPPRRIAAAPRLQADLPRECGYPDAAAGGCRSHRRSGNA